MPALNGFEVVNLAIANDYPPDDVRRKKARKLDSKPDPRRNIKAAMHSTMHSKENLAILFAYEQARVALERTLGPAELICDQKGTHTEFHPRAKMISETEKGLTSGKKRKVSREVGTLAHYIKKARILKDLVCGL